jgi:2-methylcitrate dehydratase PrpD
MQLSVAQEDHMTVALALATFACNSRATPKSVRAAAVRAVFDLIAAAVAGHVTVGGIAGRKAAIKAWGSGPAACWLSGERLTVPGAAFANSAIASMLDLDDGHRAASGHPGAGVIPAVMATAEATGAPAERVLTAIALGYEIGVRISAARDFRSLHTFDSGLWCGQGVAGAVGWLRGLSPEAIAHAIAIAGTTAPGQTATGYTRLMGNNVKEGIAWATATGVTAVELAAHGFTGPTDFLDDATRYDPAILTRALGERWHIEDGYFKLYSCCRWAHAAIDGMLELRQQEGIGADDIVAVRIGTFAQTLSLNNDLVPPTMEAAQYSVPFCVAVAAVRGAAALLPLEAATLGDALVLDCARKISMTVDPTLDAMFPSAVPARIEVETRRGRFSRTVTAPRGESSNPLGWDDLGVKFQSVARGRISPVAAAALVEAVAALDAGDIRPLLVTLATPAQSLAPAAAARNAGV